MKEGKKFRVIPIDKSNDVLIKIKAPVNPHTDIVMPPSGDTFVTISGRKCDHGVYIPANAESPDHAPFCSVCYPYEFKNGGQNESSVRESAAELLSARE